MKTKTTIVAAMLLSLGLLASVSANAQQEGAANAAAPSIEISNQQLQQFANASEEVVTLSQEYTQQLHTTEDEAAQRAIQEEANEKMIDAVESNGLDVDTFNIIGQAIQTNPELMQRVQEMVGS
jgi:GTP1/Obg family GTP-binding protein